MAGGRDGRPAQQPRDDVQRPAHEVRLGRVKAAVWASPISGTAMTKKAPFQTPHKLLAKLARVSRGGEAVNKSRWDVFA